MKRYNKLNNRDLLENLQCSLSMPSTTHTYSVITEFVRLWFLSKFSGSYFKQIHIEGKHVFDDFRKFTIPDRAKFGRPALAIIPKINLSFNRDMLDTNQFGADMLMKTARLDRSLIRDYRKNLFIGASLELLEIDYTFMIKVESRSQQIDLYKYLCTVFSIGHTSEANIDLDFHIPYTMMLQLAKDSGYEIKDNKVVDVIKFIKYINSISRLPVMFKYRTINGRMEYFMRFHDMEIMIDLTNELSHDDGVNKGMLMKNFGIEMDVKVKAPSPKFFIYYSSNKHELIQPISTGDVGDSVIYPIYTIEIEKVPKINEKGWNQYLTTEYYYEDTEEYVSIDFTELFKAGTDIYRVIELCKSTGISPDTFIDFKVYNGINKDLPYSIDWDHIKMTFDVKVESPTSFISIYIDTDYAFERIKEMDNMNRSRGKTNSSEL